ncbi:MAG: hypothetical protein CL677_06815 [Bdellovibrionaceae bacterium]|nr:hypothetical protein [Pseudobdellovibrionaceae bacterium]|tara:strand:- start:560 stop:1117 length:558 start_codon:yes stop_codon:yes gene_type:complete
MKKLLLLTLGLVFATATSHAAERMKVFTSQKGLPLKSVKHEFVLSTNSAGFTGTGNPGTTAGIHIADGESVINLGGQYRYSFNPYLQFEGRLGILTSEALDITQFGFGALYNFGEGKIGNQMFGGGGINIFSGDFDPTYIYGIFGKRFALSRHISYAPYAQILLPTDSDFDTVISLIPLSLSALF